MDARSAGSVPHTDCLLEPCPGFGDAGNRDALERRRDHALDLPQQPCFRRRHQ